MQNLWLFSKPNNSILSKYQVTTSPPVRMFSLTRKPPLRGLNWCVSQICMKILHFIKNQGLSEVTSLAAAFIKSLADRGKQCLKKIKRSRRSCFSVSRMFLYSLCISLSSSWHQKCLIMLFPVLPYSVIVQQQCILFKSNSSLQK